MKVKNARIKNATVTFDVMKRLCLMMDFETQDSNYSNYAFILTEPTDVQCLSKLMNYANAYDLKRLNGKIIRIVDQEYSVCGFGDPIKDKFILNSRKDLREVTETQLKNY